eukprot:CAMPEP_0119338774 /NCGR_PEP_ID=MMETSP1333-20130426/96894_1 /TAXON_ID=418940 /ORGANISM="Scyphosphaera apsteinii, Strain RCC1455" /LENGTH=285 /DNA_ID=CAMNT_0007350165 /DNA_START=177 /DNA_END=1034 /DNA_ORIENTATION=-
MEWLRRTNLTTGLKGAAFLPSIDEFDIDATRHGKWGPWLTAGKDAEEAIEAAKGVNRWLFYEDVMRSGRLASTATPGMHVYILRMLRSAAVNVQRPTFVDAGCGTGFLLQAWLLMAGADARAIGLELDALTAAQALWHLHHPEAVGIGLAASVHGATVHVGDALSPDVRKLGLREGTVDAINVGLAVDHIGALEPLARLLRAGGLMSAPLCKTQQPADMPQDKCAARFRILSKGIEGTLSPQPSDPDIDVRFIRGMVSAPHSIRKNSQLPRPRQRMARHLAISPA